MDNTNNQNVLKNNKELVDLFHRASRLITRSYHRRNHAHHAQARALSIIREKGSINQRDLLEMLDVRSSSLSEVLGKLERNGQIVREKNDEDNRSFIISAAEESQPLGEGPADIPRQEVESLFACLNDQEREQLGSILEKLVLALKDDSLCQDFLSKNHKRGRGCRKQGCGDGKSRGFKPKDHGGRTFHDSKRF